MTHKIFWDDPYCTEHQTTVTRVDGNDITLESTIFFAFSGGQESDSGFIQGIPVISAEKKKQEIIYSLPEGHNLVVGQEVAVKIDWARRYQLMRLHFAAELVLELVYKALDGIDKVGAHIAQNKARIDFLWAQSISPLLPEFTDKANDIIFADLKILTGFENEANERRYWEIDGFSRVPCGGTHVRSTGEIGAIRLKRNNIGKGKERIEIYLNE